VAAAPYSRSKKETLATKATTPKAVTNIMSIGIWCRRVADLFESVVFAISRHLFGSAMTAAG
jgi:hypothetical protein